MSKLLIIDDDEDFLVYAETILKPVATEIHKLQSAVNAEQVIESLKPDLIISDIIMPDREGMELLIELKGKYSIPIIMTSIEGFYIELASDLGADAVVEKPIVDTQAFRSLVKQFL